jgi:hypothetical protein
MKPGIFILATDDKETFPWISDFHGKKESFKKLFAKASAIIKAGTSKEEVTQELEAAGFEVRDLA